MGLLAGSLASFFRLEGPETGDGSSLEPGTSPEPAPSEDGEAYRALVREMAQLREQMARLSEQLARGSPSGRGDAA